MLVGRRCGGCHLVAGRTAWGRRHRRPV